MVEQRKETVTVRLELDPSTSEVLDKLSVNSRRKSEVINLLLQAAAERQAAIEKGESVPMDALTRALVGLELQKEDFQRKQRRTQGEDETEG